MDGFEELAVESCVEFLFQYFFFVDLQRTEGREWKVVMDLDEMALIWACLDIDLIVNIGQSKYAKLLKIIYRFSYHFILPTRYVESHDIWLICERAFIQRPESNGRFWW